jgi:5-methylcytosine-specific restriction endonuclease McrA
MPPQRRHGAAGHRWEQFTKLVFATYGDQCWLCGHFGARQVDHVESLTEHPELALVLSNCRPAHGAPGNACPACSKAAGAPINCNGIRGGYSPERARRIIAERTGIAQPPRKRKPDDPGRDW